MLGLGLSLTNFGSKGGIADVADGGSLAALMLASETQGLAIDFTDLSMVVKDTGTPANAFAGDPNSKLTYASPSTKWVLGRSGLYESGTTLRTEYNASGVALGVRIEEARTNLFLNSRAPLTQSITTTAQSYTISGVGAVGATIVLSGTATGTLTGTAALAGDTLTFTATAGTLTCTVTGTWDFVQVEAGAFRTSPIVTAGSTVTRATDNISIATSAFPYVAATSTICVKAIRLSTSSIEHILGISDGTTSNWARIYFVGGDANSYATITSTAGGSQLDRAKSPITLGAAYKRALAWQLNSANDALNGAAPGADQTTQSILTGANVLNIGRSGSGNTTGGFYIQQVMYVPRRMSNVELQALTA